MTKRCSHCHREQALDQFRVRSAAKGTRQSWCTSCFRERDKASYAKSSSLRARIRRNHETRRELIRRMLWEYLLSHPCECGERDPVVLEFHHHGEKEKEIANALRDSWSWPRIEAEISKCRVMCANCHKRLTAKAINSYRYRLGCSLVD